MPQPAVATATMACSFGMAPSTMAVTRSDVLIEGRPAATVADTVPFVNVPPFGMCQSLANPAVASATAAALGTLTPMPCTPVITGPWTPTAPKTQVGGVPVLASGAITHCAYGGVISMTVPGATRTTAS